MRNLIADNGYIVISLPHVGNNAVVASILNADFGYHNFGLLDKTHIRFFGIKNMQNLFENAGYKIVAAEFVVTPPKYTELASHWKSLPSSVRSALSYNPFGDVYQVVIKAVPSAAPCEGLKLINLLVPKYKHGIKNTIKDWLRLLLSPDLYQLIKRLLKK